MSIFDFLGVKKSDAAAASGTVSDTVRKITDQLNRMEPGKAKYIASFAYLLGRVANADLTISRQETREMERIIQDVAGLPEEQAILVVQIAQAQHALFGSTENFTVTQEFNAVATRAQKLALLKCLFAVSSSDLSISTVEDNEVRKVSRELRLDHSDFIAARSSYRDYLEVLKKRPDK